MQGQYVAVVFLNLIQTQQIVDVRNIVDLIQVYDHPENTFQFTDVREKTVLAQFLYDQKIQFNLIKQKIEQLLDELAIWQSELVEQSTNLLNVMKKDDFKSLFQQLTNQDKGVKKEVIQELQNKFYNYFKSIEVMNQVSTQKDLESLDQIYDNMNKKIIISGQFEELFQLVNKAEIDYLQIANPFTHLIMNTIQKNVKRQIIKKQPIYRSRENGLTFDAIKNAIVGRQNLLWFFKSSNNGCTEFGGYTPYSWQDDRKPWGATVSNPSFLFSKTLKQIYPIIIERGGLAQQFSQANFILFGGTCNGDEDLRINPDFKSGYSRLGVTYQAPAGLDTTKHSTHLFGALAPNVIECEIYQIFFE
ncbi:unnamed protein product (macronuclear) [Paramecium tetraurelia]|uniref:TLDc domain-containing protein n=1 Tax=Paramecium tetraurelia TaxID=5888 RepID=A0CBS5_PARTE|nr:uncharacterized protein GSPATT00037025001 [Paramecium tetraurelia]CAK68242.1 unnamed protein product [Paramecium tetraurelia]|eukprot:XP_001435639.1 hypothetical protein (macronuclear) [Paramecium tetraurelia strain d4-2]